MTGASALQFTSHAAVIVGAVILGCTRISNSPTFPTGAVRGA